MRPKLQGSLAFPFSEMVRDTIRAFGVSWAFRHYVCKLGLSAWEFRIFSGI